MAASKLDSLFATGAKPPLAEQMRPKSLKDIVGQEHLLAADQALGRMLEQKRLASMILWGPPGVGKTSMARLLAEQTGMEFVTVSAIFSGVRELRKLFDDARQKHADGRQTLLFIDEIHRFNRAQQDCFLPVVENGTIILVGATTENPSFELNGALLSRCQIMVLKRLDEAALQTLLERAETHHDTKLRLTPEARYSLCVMADGDGRYLLNMAEELLADPPQSNIDPANMAKRLLKRAPAYDKNREEHYNLISALHKSVRSSDPDAALYWLARMLEGGEDPLYIARRLIRIASEDIGLADPSSLLIATAATSAYERLGSPEGELALAHALIHLATAPKSNAAYRAFQQAEKAARQTGSLSPPPNILNAPTKLMQKLGYGSGYEYDPDLQTGVSNQRLFPENMQPQNFYKPKGEGREAAINSRMQQWRILRDKARKQ